MVAFQDVDNFGALERFLSAYYAKLGEKGYGHAVLHEGNDMRGIDVAIATHADWPIYTRSHVDLTPAWLDDTESGVGLLASKLGGKASTNLGAPQSFIATLNLWAAEEMRVWECVSWKPSLCVKS